METEIKKLVEIILREVELRDSPTINGAIPVVVSSKKFEYPEDVPQLVGKINGARKGKPILRIFTPQTFKNSSESGSFTSQSVIALRNKRSILELQDMGEKWDLGAWLYFLIEDIDVLRDTVLPLGKKIVYFDEKRTITFKDKRHVFHTGSGKRGLPLRFFKILWKNRSEKTRGKSGNRQTDSYYAQQLDLTDDSYVYKNSPELQQKVSNLIKGLNRIFTAKKIPARVTTDGGVLLEIKNS